MSKHDRNRAEKRDRLMRAGLDAFTETGYENTTVRDIVRRAGMTPSTFYNYFRDKEALRAELLAQVADGLVAGLATVRSQTDNVGDFTRQAARTVFAALLADKGLAMLLKRNLAMVRSMIDNEALNPAYSALRGALERLVGEERARGVDIDYAAVLLRGGIVEVGIALLDSSDPEVDRAAEMVAAMISGGVERVVAGGQA